MALSPLFAERRSRRGVSELYASMLMIGVTLSIGGFVAMAATSGFGLAAGSASLGTSLQQSSSELRVGLVYSAVVPSGSCPVYQGFTEGTSLTLSFYDYGTVGFAPVEFVLNSTAYAGSYATLTPGTMSQYTIALSSCAHSSGQTVLAVDSQGDEMQVET